VLPPAASTRREAGLWDGLIQLLRSLTWRLSRCQSVCSMFRGGAWGLVFHIDCGAHKNFGTLGVNRRRLPGDPATILNRVFHFEMVA
jgi:hypothetical protein